MKRGIPPQQQAGSGNFSCILADRTNGCAYATVLRLSSLSSSVCLYGMYFV